MPTADLPPADTDESGTPWLPLVPATAASCKTKWINCVTVGRGEARTCRRALSVCTTHCHKCEKLFEIVNCLAGFWTPTAHVCFGQGVHRSVNRSPVALATTGQRCEDVWTFGCSLSPEHRRRTAAWLEPPGGACISCLRSVVKQMHLKNWKKTHHLY